MRADSLAMRAIAWLALLLSGCVEEGHVPDCPAPEDFLKKEQQLDETWRDSAEFEKWRTASEKAGCLTQLGGTPGGQRGM